MKLFLSLIFSIFITSNLIAQADEGHAQYNSIVELERKYNMETAFLDGFYNEQLSVISKQESVSNNCKQPADSTEVSFKSTDCAGNPGLKFTNATTLTYTEGAFACGAAQGQWKNYCECMGKDLKCDPMKFPPQFTRVNRCEDDPNMTMQCGKCECIDKKTPTSPTKTIVIR